MPADRYKELEDENARLVKATTELVTARGLASEALAEATRGLTEADARIARLAARVAETEDKLVKVQAKLKAEERAHALTAELNAELLGEQDSVKATAEQRLKVVETQRDEARAEAAGLRQSTGYQRLLATERVVENLRGELRTMTAARDDQLKLNRELAVRCDRADRRASTLERLLAADDEEPGVDNDTMEQDERDEEIDELRRLLVRSWGLL